MDLDSDEKTVYMLYNNMLIKFMLEVATMHQLNLHRLATFQVVAKHCSYSRAADELHFSQPAVSAQIRLLEDSLGVRLFDKIGHKTHLTPAGEELYRYSEKIFALIDETIETMDTLRNPHYGHLRVGADTTVGTYVVPRVLGKFRQLYPNVEITLEVVNRGYLVDDLSQNRVDMVIMGKIPTEIPAFVAPFAPNELVLIAPPTHRLAGCKRIPFSELAREHFLLREIGSGTRNALEQAFQNAGYPLLVSMQMGNNSAIKQSVAAGLGIALISRVAIDIELETNRLVILDAEGFPITLQWRLVHLKDKNLSATARAFKNFLLQNSEVPQTLIS
ncbi:LysR family transcriptional regulator [Dictyobacter aurantiacus]|uniref:LysR family transcriptional regulator n=1 Tax=Dictyobacter aurantiacus TaxID=1936993 RepID=A0A401ZJX2_9CHLR|nr:LysR family transcriptional regulator [Dictyobacter aurantiacus]GCE07132.1 LysR family transcriptional regulator [Dictyobacter aurantiacus]